MNDLLPGNLLLFLFVHFNKCCKRKIKRRKKVQFAMHVEYFIQFTYITVRIKRLLCELSESHVT